MAGSEAGPGIQLIKLRLLRRKAPRNDDSMFFNSHHRGNDKRVGMRMVSLNPQTEAHFDKPVIAKQGVENVNQLRLHEHTDRSIGAQLETETTGAVEISRLAALTPIRRKTAVLINAHEGRSNVKHEVYAVRFSSIEIQTNTGAEAEKCVVPHAAAHITEAVVVRRRDDLDIAGV